MKTVLTGITRNYSNKDGELEVMENLRHDGASLRPIGAPEEIKFYMNYGTDSQTEYQMPDYEKIVFVHQFRGREFVISYRVTETDSNLYLLGELIGNVIAINKDNNGYGNILSCPGLIKIVQLGIYLYVHTKDKDYTLRMEYNEKLEEIMYHKTNLNLLDVNMFVSAQKNVFRKELCDTMNYDDNSDWAEISRIVESTIYLSGYTGYYLELLNEAKEKGCLYDACFVRGALRLKSGDYVMHTAPILLNPIGGDVAYTETYIRAMTDYEEKEGKKYCKRFAIDAQVDAYKINVSIPKIDILDFETEIESFDIFIAPIPNIITDRTTPRGGQPSEQFGLLVHNDGYYQLNYGNTYIFESGNLEERIKGISVGDFKYVKSYSLSALQNGIKEKLDLVKFLKGETESRSFSDDDFSRDTLKGYPFAYNNMLHLGKVEQTWYEGYNIESFLAEGVIDNNNGGSGGGDLGGDDGNDGNDDNNNGGAGGGSGGGGNKFYCWCGYIYNESLGDPEGGIQPGMPFGFLPEDWRCPVCGSPKTVFEADSGNMPDYVLPYGMRTLSNEENYKLKDGTLKGISVSFTGDNKVANNSIELNRNRTELGYLISYPRKGLIESKIKAITQNGEEYIIFSANKPLKDMEFLNLSYLIGNITTVSYKAKTKEGETSLDCVSQKIEKIDILQEGILDELDYSYLENVNYPNEARDNILKVSDINNPLIFPSKQTYQVGQGEIKDLSVASTALSQGQFGQFPLYVFCSDGIYAMNVGTGVAYTNSTPVSRDVITGDLISIDKAVAFISDRGLKILQGDSAVDVSLQMQSNAYEQLQGETFEDFIKGAKLAYNYFFGEIYLLREDKEFAFVYELKNQTWATRKINFKGKLDVYPDLYIQTKEGVYRLSREIYPPDGTQKVKLKTRPMKWGDGFKKVTRMIIRGLVIGNWDIKILASNDGVNFHEIRRASISTNTPKRDIPFGRISGSFKYYVLEIEADMDEKSYIEYLETELQNSIFNNKLR